MHSSVGGRRRARWSTGALIALSLAGTSTVSAAVLPSTSSETAEPTGSPESVTSAPDTPAPAESPDDVTDSVAPSSPVPPESSAEQPGTDAPAPPVTTAAPDLAADTPTAPVEPAPSAPSGTPVEPSEQAPESPVTPASPAPSPAPPAPPAPSRTLEAPLSSAVPLATTSPTVMTGAGETTTTSSGS